MAWLPHLHYYSENCVFVPPKVNLELWKLLSGWQRKCDIKFMSIQKSVVRKINASLSILSEVHSGDFSVQSIAHKTADIAAILGQASDELSLKQRVFIRSVISSEYKDLCSSSQIRPRFCLETIFPKWSKNWIWLKNLVPDQ